MAARHNLTTTTALAALYEWLRASSKTLSACPPPDRIEFRWRHKFDMYGQCSTHVKNIKRGAGKVATIAITALNKTPQALVETMAHEMVHCLLRTDEVALRGRIRSAHHGRKFRAAAHRVCVELHLNETTF